MPRGSNPHVERDRLLRRLRPADGTRARAPRPHEPGDPLGGVAFVQTASEAGGSQETGRKGRFHLRDQPWSSLGGRRVLDRALLAYRPGWRDGDTTALREPLSGGREADGRGFLSLDVRELGAGTAGASGR